MIGGVSDVRPSAMNAPSKLPFTFKHEAVTRYRRHLGHCFQCARQFHAHSIGVVADVSRLHPMLGTYYCSEKCARERIDSADLSSALEYLLGCASIIEGRKADDARLPGLREEIRAHQHAVGALL